MRPDIGWFALVVKSKSEFVLSEQLRRRGFRVITPREVRWRRPSYRVKRYVPRDYPVFARNVFVNIQGDDAWAKLRLAPFVQGVLSMGGKPYRLADKDVAYLHEMAGRYVPPQSVSANPYVAPGHPAHVVDGPFRGHTITVQSIEGNEVEALWRLFGSLRTIRLPLASLEAA